MSKKPMIIAAIVLAFLALVGVGVWSFARKDNGAAAEAKPTPKPKPVNIIPVSERPYVTLQPLTGRNQLEIVFHDLKKPADSVEVVLEYDRNKGVLDAVMAQFMLASTPYKDMLFLGSKSAGGHITYHDDVIGGKLHLEFDGADPYTLEVPWRYDDKQKEYSQFSTADGKFQANLEKPYKTDKVVVMQSPGLPQNLDGEVVAGPYLIRGVGVLPKTNATLSIRLPEAETGAKLFGWDGTAWQTINSQVNEKTLTATSPFYEVFVVTK